MKVLKNKEKFVITGKLLTTNDGAKMGKTEGNMIRMDDSPEDIYGKVMAFSDNLILTGFEILTFATMSELENYKKRLNSGENPMILKKELAFRITSEITSQEEATKAQRHFEMIFQKKDAEAEIQTKEILKTEIVLNELLLSVEFASSKSEAKRLIEQGAVTIDNEKITQFSQVIHIPTSHSLLLKVGKKVCKITN